MQNGLAEYREKKYIGFSKELGHYGARGMRNNTSQASHYYTPISPGFCSDFFSSSFSTVSSDLDLLR